MSLDPTPRPWRVGGRSIGARGERWSIWGNVAAPGVDWPIGEVGLEDDAKLIVAAVNAEKVLLVEEDHELCESQVSELVRELEFIRDSKAFSQLSHAKQDHLNRAIRTRGIKTT